ncbi:hypothetical protein K3495_g15393 [Podosphaera aphanis]|nr:hypothetical protein K3495_g15393 [Podosphaera aphanis]
MLMTIDNQIRGRRAEKNHRNSAGQFTNAPHPSHVPGGLAPMDLSASTSHRAQRPAAEERYTFVNGQRKTTAAEKQWRKENNLCMYCAGAGHSYSNCPTANRPKDSQPKMTGALAVPFPEATSESGFQ